MRRILFLLVLFLMTGLPVWSQESFSLEGTLGSDVGSPETYSLSMVGRLHLNETLSAGVGLGLWNSGFASNWFEEYNNRTAALFRLSDNQTVPSFQVNLRAEKPLLSVGNKPLSVFVEPGVYFLPTTTRTISLSETYYTGTLNPSTNKLDYTERSVDPTYSGQTKTDNKPLLGWELKGGLSLKVADNVSCAFSCAYQRIDLFQNLETASLLTHETNEQIDLGRFSPNAGRFQLQLSFIYLFPLK